MSANSVSETSLPRLGPTWRSSSQGRGFQPPPAVPASNPEKSSNSSHNDDEKKHNSNRNSFSLLDMDDEGQSQLNSSAKKKGEDGNGHNGASSSPMRSANSGSGRFMSRSEGLRSSTGSGTGGYFSTRSSKMKGKVPGRSLADLASRFTSGSGRTQNHRDAHPHGHSHSHGSTHREESTSGSGRLSSLRGGGDLSEEKKIVRFTRERLLSMRPRPEADVAPPSSLSCLEGTALMSNEPLDPVCWDSFDANEIWSQVARDRPARTVSKQVGGTGSILRDRKEAEREERRPSFPNDGGDKWRRGQALPPAEQGSTRRNGGRYDDMADNPEDLWDDPSDPSTGAAADFSAFGGTLDGDPLKAGDAFDLTQMSDAAKQFEEDLHGSKSNGDPNDPDESGTDHAVNPTRPLASAGTTIRSGSGDDVNVFEDFGEPDSSAKKSDKPTIKSGDEQTPSSRLMQMIGVTNDDKNDKEANKNEENEPVAPDVTSSLFGFSSGISKNPWGDPSPVASNTPPESFGLDLGAKLRGSSIDQQTEKQKEADRLKREDEERIRLMEAEEAKRRAALLAQQQQEEAELQARQQAAAREQQKQSQHGHSQIELILTERISTILENSWGRSDLVTVLTTLHNEDTRVVPLLGTVDALRALIVRHPRRFALAKDPSFGADVAVLLMNNAAWQQQKQQQQQQQAEDLQRRQQAEHQNMLAQQAAARVEAESRAQSVKLKPIVITNNPWFYADPQGNVQGPFGGEEMRQWLEAGYFKGDLPISQDPEGQFRPLSSLFPDVAVAFKPNTPSEVEVAAMAKVEEEAKLKAEAEAAASAAAEAEAKEAAERERAAKERAEMEARVKAEEEAESALKASEAARQQQEEIAQSNETQSAQLKMLLGLGGAGSSSSVVGGISKEVTEVNKSTISADKQNEPQPQSKISKPKESNKTNGSTKSQAQSISAPAPAWGGAGTSKPTVQKKSMSEIQKEEATIAARIGTQRPHNTGGWANIAASGGTTAWSGNAAVISSAPVSIASVSSSQTNAGMLSRTKQQITGTAAQKQANSQSSTQKTMEEFGANDKMTPVLENWCKDQMRKLSGSDDLTLIAFCMTLSDSVEIKGYLTAYLGSTPQVNNFATEFINRKNGTKQQEQWETTGGSKKGRKKKGTVGK